MSLFRHVPWFRTVLVTLFVLQGGPAPAMPSPSWSGFDTPWFTRLGVDDGLPHPVTTAVAQDRRGLVWIGTMGGLVRYDGYRMDRFGSRRKSHGGLPDSYVRCLLALPGGGMLIGTNAGGLARFDPGTGHFHVYPVGPAGTSDAKIYDLAADRTHGAWIATDRGIDHLNLDTNSISHTSLGPTMAPRNFSVLEDHAGNLWVGNDRGLFVRHAGTRTFERPAADNAVVATVLDNQIWALREDREGRLWVGSGQAGVAYRDRQGHWHPVPGFSGYDHGARRATVRTLLDNGDGSTWIGTDGAGIIVYRPGATQTTHIDHDPARTSSLPGNTVRSLLEDRSGNVWAATDVGVALSDIRARAAFSILPSPLRQHALSDANVHDIFVDSRGRIWLGLGTGHIDVINPDTGRMHHLHLGDTQAHRDVHGFAETADGRIWVGTRGMARIDPDTFAVHDSVLPALADKPVLSLLHSGPYLLIGTYEGVYRYDTRDGGLSHFRHHVGDPSSLASDTVRQIVRIGDEIWYATTRGISVATSVVADNGFRQLRHHAGDSESLPQDYVGGIARGPHGRIWVATFGGVAVIDHYVPGAAVRFRTFGVAQGLADDKINAVVIDADGNPWVSMSSGIARIDAASGAVSNLGPRDGEHINAYLYIAAAESRGDLLFGGLGGLTVVRPRMHMAPPASGRLEITAAAPNGHPLPPADLPRDGRPITVGSGGRSLRVDFALLDYHAPRQTTYSYRMTGFGDGWNEIPKGAPPTATYTNLPHGRYTLKLRAVTGGMQPRVLNVRFPITVTPLWYETLPFRLLAALLAVAAIFGLVHLRTLYLRHQAYRLQQLVDARTSELRDANHRLDQLAGTDELSGLYNRRRFLELAEEVRQRATEGKACMVLLDLDHFKDVNDTFGHLAGDAVIRAAAEVVRRHCREGDLAARFGGEEMMLCLPDITLDEAMRMAERIRTMLEQTSVSHGPACIRTTASFGLAGFRRHESIEQWLARTDVALYAAKHAGRNRCVGNS